MPLRPGRPCPRTPRFHDVKKCRAEGIGPEAGEREDIIMLDHDTLETIETITTTAENGAVIFVPLNKLKKSPRNARKMPHGTAHIEALAASISAKGLLQNLVVEPENDGEGKPTGFYFVTIGEGRRLAQRLRVKRKQIKKTEPIRCVLDTVNDAHEISLDENVTREAMHPADQFEAFRVLAEERGFGVEDIAARFGVSAQVVRQRLRLGAVSPKLMQVYRDGDLTLQQMMAFAITEDQARQEEVYESLSHNREPWVIRRELTSANVPASDRRAVFVGPEAYTEAGGTFIRDLFDESCCGFYEDTALLDRLALAKLETVAAEIRETEGWKWTDVHVEYPHAHGLRRVYPRPVDLSEEDTAAQEAAQAEYDRLLEDNDGKEDLPEDLDRRLAELEAEIERIDDRRHAYDPEEVARGGAFVILNYDGTVRIERGFIRPEDEAPEAVGEETAIEDGPEAENASETGKANGNEEKPLSDALVRDLTAHRTLGLRLALGEWPDVALVAVVHALASQTFYRYAEASCLEIRPTSAHLAPHADGIEDTAPAQALADRHAAWAAEVPRDVTELWDFVSGLDPERLLTLLAHCASLTVNAIKVPWERKPNAHETAEKLATAVSLDMTAHWTPSVRTYFGRVTKARILAAVREAVGDKAADRIADLKKAVMAEAAEQLLSGTGWIPPVMRTTQPREAEVEGAIFSIADE